MTNANDTNTLANMRAMCGEQCSCADGNHQWRNPFCELIEEHAKRVAAAITDRALPIALVVRALPFLDNSDSPGGCDGKHSDCEHCSVIAEFRALLKGTDQPTLTMAQIEYAIDEFEPDFMSGLADDRETWIADNMRHEILQMVRGLSRKPVLTSGKPRGEKATP